MNGQRYQSSVSPQPTDGDFSPPSLPRTPVQLESPDFLREGRAPSGSDFEHSPYLARPADIRIPEVDHIRTRRDEPIEVSIIPITPKRCLPNCFEDMNY